MATTVAYIGAADVRTWAIAKGLTVGARGPLPQNVIDAFNKAHRAKKFKTS